MKVWKNYTTANVFIVIEKAMKTIISKTICSSWTKLCPGIVHDLKKLSTELMKKIIEETVSMSKRVGGEVFQDMDLGKI